jgi:T-complex protein 1 subunit delta
MSDSKSAPVNKNLGKSDRHDSNKEKQRDIRSANLIAAKAVSDIVRTSLGPKGMDKMIQGSNGEVVITNDGATILDKLEVMHPAARMIVNISKAQDVEAGDGTTSVVVLAGALLDAAKELLEKGVHPTVVSDSFLQASKEAQQILRNIAVPVNLDDKTELIKAAVTSLNSKVVSENSPLLAPIAVDAVMQLLNENKSDINVDLNNVRVVKKLGGTIEDTELVQGLVLDSAASHAAGGPSRIKGAKIALIRFCLSAPKSDIESQVIVSDYAQMDRILKEERRYILKMVKKIVKSGCNVLMIQKSIMRDSVNDLSLHYLAKNGIMVVRDVERTDVEFITKTLGCQPVSNIDGFVAERLGYAELAEESNTPSGKIIKITGVKNPGRTVSVLVRGSNRLVIEEAHRSIHDALCVVRSLIKERFLVPGGAAPETEVCVQLGRLANKIGGIHGYCMRKYAEAMEVIPYTLAENAGLHPIEIVSELKKQHVDGVTYAGINVKKGKITNILEENVVQPLLVSTSALKLATEFTRAILKIDDVVAIR